METGPRRWDRGDGAAETGPRMEPWRLDCGVGTMETGPWRRDREDRTVETGP